MMASFLQKHRVQRSFSKAASHYSRASFLQQEVAKRLDERLEYTTIVPKTILDLGAGTGFCSALLARRFPKANMIAVDISQAMLKRSKGVCADAARLPFASHSFDLVFSNLLLHWCEEPQTVLNEMKRVLKPNGALFISMMGTATLQELKQSWQTVDQHQHVNPFVDMHFVGDWLLASGFRDPVVDRETLVFKYNDTMQLLHDLKSFGSCVVSKQRFKGLLGRKRLTQLLRAYEAHRDEKRLTLPATFEIIYGHAWGGSGSFKQNAAGEVVIPLSALKRRGVN